MVELEKLKLKKFLKDNHTKYIRAALDSTDEFERNKNLEICELLKTIIDICEERNRY